MEARVVVVAFIILQGRSQQTSLLQGTLGEIAWQVHLLGTLKNWTTNKGVGDTIIIQMAIAVWEK